MQKELSPQQVSEWTENPVTREALNLLREAIQFLQEERLSAYVPSEPQKTQEFLAICLGRQESLELSARILEGDWDDYFEEDDEQERNPPPTG